MSARLNIGVSRNVADCCGDIFETWERYRHGSERRIQFSHAGSVSWHYIHVKPMHATTQLQGLDTYLDLAPLTLVTALTWLMVSLPRPTRRSSDILAFTTTLHGMVYFRWVNFRHHLWILSGLWGDAIAESCQSWGSCMPGRLLLMLSLT